MGSVYCFFRKYFLSTALILLLFILTNIVLMFGVLVFARSHSSKPDLPAEAICDAIALQSDGTITADDFVADTLKQKDAWAMMIDNDGTVCWQFDLPKDLPLTYTPTDIAKFSKWYLNDYPTYVYEHPAGLLVLGCNAGSLVKWNFSIDTDYISALLLGALFMIVANILLFCILLWRNTRKMELAVSPILHGIEQISDGKEISLPKKGELAEINEKLNAASAHLWKKDQARAEWINGISHDVRTPLSYILGYAGKLEDSNLPPDVREQAATIRIQGEKLRRLITDLNLCTKLEYSMQPLSVQSIDILEIVRQVIVQNIESGLCERHAIHLPVDACDSFCIQGDAALLTRMLENLIGNSIIHNPDGCSIDIQLSERKGICMLSVQDDGKGASDAILARLNSNRFLTEYHTTSSEAAHGMGLRLVCQIVKAHHGTIQFHHRKPHGFCVEIELPMIVQ